MKINNNLKYFYKICGGIAFDTAWDVFLMEPGYSHEEIAEELSISLFDVKELSLYINTAVYLDCRYSKLPFKINKRLFFYYCEVKYFIKNLKGV